MAPSTARRGVRHSAGAAPGEPLLPVFLRLAGRKVVLVGGGTVARGQVRRAGGGGRADHGGGAARCAPALRHARRRTVVRARVPARRISTAPGSRWPPPRRRSTGRCWQRPCRAASSSTPSTIPPAATAYAGSVARRARHHRGVDRRHGARAGRPGARGAGGAVAGGPRALVEAAARPAPAGAATARRWPSGARCCWRRSIGSTREPAPSPRPAAAAAGGQGEAAHAMTAPAADGHRSCRHAGAGFAGGRGARGRRIC